MPLVYERHTIAFFGPLAQPNYQMYSVVITNNNIFSSHTERTSTQQNLLVMYSYMRTFASFSQKPPLKFIYEYEHELSYNT